VRVAPGRRGHGVPFGQFELADATEACSASTRTSAGPSTSTRRRALGRFRDGGVLLFDDAYETCRAAQRRAGQPECVFAATGEQVLPIAGTFSKKDAVGNDYLLPMPVFEQNYTDQADVHTAIKIPPDVTVRRAERVIDRA
jgi:hypothetical protein